MDETGSLTTSNSSNVLGTRSLSNNNQYQKGLNDFYFELDFEFWITIRISISISDFARDLLILKT